MFCTAGDSTYYATTVVTNGFPAGACAPRTAASSTGCATPSLNSDTCITCSSGYYLLAAGCTARTTLSTTQCATAITNIDVCLLCNAGYYINGALGCTVRTAANLV